MNIRKTAVCYGIIYKTLVENPSYIRLKITKGKRQYWKKSDWVKYEVIAVTLEWEWDGTM